MSIDIEAVRNALSLFHDDDTLGTVIRGNFLEFSNKVKITASTEPDYRRMSRNLDYIRQDIWNIKAVLHKLDFLNSIRSNGQLNEFAWIEFAMTDIEFFFTEIRSIFDYLSLLLSSISPIDIRQIRDHGTSFNTLFNWLNGNSNNQSRFSQDLSNLVLSCDWFDDLKDFRDLIRHHGGYSLIFIVDGRILFQIFTGAHRARVRIPEIMYNENVVDFQLCSALYISYLLNFLEEISITCEPKLTLLSAGRNATNIGSSNRIVKKWIEELLERLESQENL